MPDLDESLTALARYAGRTGHLAPAATVRARSDRRRRRRYVTTAALGVALAGALGVGIAIAQPKPTSPPVPNPAASSPSPSPSRSPSPSPSPSLPEPPHKLIPTGTAAPTAPEVLPTGPGLTEAQAGLTYRRAYTFVPLVRGQEVASTVMTVLATGRVEITTDHGPSASFTTAALSPGGAGWLIRADREGGSQCLSVRADGKLETKKCVPGPAQEVRYYDAGKDGRGRRAFAIGFGQDSLGLGPEKSLTWDPESGDGLIVKEMPATGPETTWVLVDRGPSTLAK